MPRPVAIVSAIAIAVAVAAAGCVTQRTVGQPSFDVREQPVRVGAHDKVDLLFMIDNSPSMAPKQEALRKSFPELVTRIERLATNGLPASFHLGVVDSDLGAGPYTLNQGQCHPDGDGGRLHITPVSPDVAGCGAMSVTDGADFLAFDSGSGAGNVAGVDLPTAFGCIASVGDAGCGFEHQLETVYRVLTTPSVNPGFLRDDALLVVVWLTDEDDCSAPPDSDLFDPSASGVAKYGPLHSFRCSQRGLTCNGAPLDATTAPDADCAPTVGGPLYDVGRYTDLFVAPRALGGVKDDPSDVLLVALTAPPAPVGAEVTTPCADQPSTPSCTILSHSCVSPIAPTFFGDPAVRLLSVVRAGFNGIAASICDTDYTSALDSVADSMGARMRGGCLPGAVVDLTDPQCTVTLGDTVVTRCGDGHLPCWSLVTDVDCPARPTPAGATQQYRLDVQGVTGAAGKTLTASCPLYVPTS